MEYLKFLHAQMVHLFMLVDSLEDYLSCDSIGLSDIMGIKCYTFKELVLEYGPEHKLTVKVVWDAALSKCVSPTHLCSHLCINISNEINITNCTLQESFLR
jgi:hypothetical protein